jgi:rare lipoprotein A
MSLRGRRTGIVAVAFVAGASILRVSASAASPFSSTESHRAALVAPAPKPSPEAIGGTVAAATSSAASNSGTEAVALSETRLGSAPGQLWAIRLPSSGAGAASRLTLRSRLADTASPGSTIAVQVRVGAGPRETVLTNAATVRQLLRAMRVHMGDDDLVRPTARTPLSVARKVRVLKVKRVTESVTVAVPFPTVVHYTDGLSVGHSVVNRSGSNGLARQTVVSTYLNGRLISRKIVASQVITAPVEQIVLKGNSTTPGGSRVGTASWYGCSGMHAASPWLPFGTIVRVTNLGNGSSVSVVINDRGPYGPGRIIDLCSPAFSAIAPLSQGLARVQITW